MEEIKLLYHYTSLCTLFKILQGMKDQNGQKMISLRAGNAKNMNDPNDCYYFVGNVGQIVRASEEEIDKMFTEKMQFDAPYIVSLSEIKDDLHMWLCYGDDGHGVALGFNKKKIGDAVSAFFKSNKTYARLHKCLYDEPKKIYQKINSPTIDQLLSKDFWSRTDLYHISDMVKHPSYKCEKEWRIIILHAKKELVINNVYHSFEDAFYIPIPIDCLEYICIGPCVQNIEVIKKIVQDFLPNVKIKQSKIPYRSKK